MDYLSFQTGVVINQMFFVIKTATVQDGNFVALISINLNTYEGFETSDLQAVHRNYCQRYGQRYKSISANMC